MVRCELDGVMPYKGQDQLLLIRALSEYDPKITGARARHAHIPYRPNNYTSLISMMVTLTRMGIAHCLQ